MSDETTRRIAFISSYLPRRCGIATFCSDLVQSLRQAGGEQFDPLVTAMASGNEQYDENPIHFKIRRNVINDYISASDYLNYNDVDLVSVQHEFGLYGGTAGSSLNLLLERVKVPIITTLHTVLKEPEEEYYKSTINICNLSNKVIVMNRRGIDMLNSIYGVEKDKIILIPHGIPDLPFVDSSYYKHKFGMEDRTTILTFGLLNRNKGIENMLKALPAIVEADPSVLYIVLGATHPEVMRHDGEEYRFSLQQIVEELGLQDHVLFYNQFVAVDHLYRFLCATDIYVTPYLNREQITSGTLAFAVGTGKVVVSTPYWAAEELLADERGCLVPFNNPKALADTIIKILGDKTLAFSFRQKAYDYGRKITWPLIGKQYWQLFEKELKGATVTNIREKKKVSTRRKIPEPSLEHISRISDDTGLLQHAQFDFPDRKHGYCTDDNARALIAMIQYYNQYNDPQARELLNRYLSFVLHAQKLDGTFHNFMSYDRRWLEPEPAHDALGRSVWALGSALCDSFFREMVPLLKARFYSCLPHVGALSPRGKAASILGMAAYLTRFGRDNHVQELLILMADSLLGLYQSCRESNWQWFEPILSYENAILPQGLYAAYSRTGTKTYLQAAESACRFYLETVFAGRHFNFIGCNGWYPKGGEKAPFDQQPIEASSTVLMLREAYQATGNSEYLILQKIAFDWFLGRNSRQIPVYDFRTQGCCDGLTQTGVNLNQGGESMVCFLLALLSIMENFTWESTSLKRTDVPEEAEIQSTSNGKPE